MNVQQNWKYMLESRLSCMYCFRPWRQALLEIPPLALCYRLFKTNWPIFQSRYVRTPALAIGQQVYLPTYEWSKHSRNKIKNEIRSTLRGDSNPGPTANGTKSSSTQYKGKTRATRKGGFKELCREKGHCTLGWVDIGTGTKIRRGRVAIYKLKL